MNHRQRPQTTTIDSAARPRRRRRGLVPTPALGLAAAAAVATALVANSATANTSVLPTGQFNFTGKALTACPLGAVLCSSGTFSGEIAGPADFTITSVVPSTTVGVSFFTGKLVIRTDRGDLACKLNGALNLNASSQGEFAEICVISGGTAGLQGASGHLRLYGVSSTSQLVVPTGGGDYTGTLVTPPSP